MKRALIVVGMVALLSAPFGVARAGGGGGCFIESATDRTGTSIVYQGLCPTPTVLYVKVGQTVTWKNLDAIDHTVTSGFGNWASETLMQDQTFSHRFNTAGTYTYYCMLHPNMGGVIEVGSTSPAPASTTATASRSSSNAWGIAVAGLLGLVLGSAGGFGVRRKNGSGRQQA